MTAGTTIPATLLAAVRPRLVVLRPPVERESKPTRENRSSPDGELPSNMTFRQTESGAVTLRFYPERIEARGFVDGRSVVVEK